jgi:hypothetical protein
MNHLIPHDARLDRRVLVLDAEDKHRAWLSRIAHSVVTTVDVRTGCESSLDPTGYDLVVINRDGFSPVDRRKILSTLKEAREGSKRTPHPLLVSSAKQGYQELFEECEVYGLTNLLAKNEEVDAVELIVTMQKILQNDIFGLEKYFPWGVPVRSLPLSSSADRREILREAEAYAQDLRVAPRLIEGFCVVIEELIANALFNAPVDENGKQRYAHLSRCETVTLRKGEEATVTLCCDAYHLGVSVADRFGGLDVTRCLAHLVRCFRKGADQVNDQPGGAGLGLYFSFDSLSHFVLNIAKGKQTEVIGLLSVQGSYREFANRSKSFNCFVEAQGEK